MGPMMLSQVARFGNAVKAIFGVKGGSILPITPYIEPSFDVTNSRPDLLVTRGEFLWSAVRPVAPVAAQFSSTWWGTTDESIMVVTQLIVQAGAAVRIRASIPSVIVPLAGQGQVGLDDRRSTTATMGTRFPGVFSPSTEVALTAASRHTFNVAANTPVIIPVAYILQGKRSDGTPSTLLIQCETANTELIVTASGYGRVLETSELAL